MAANPLPANVGSSDQQTLRFGEGAIDEATRFARDRSARRVFCVADRVAFETSGAADRLKPIGEHAEWTLFSDFTPNPEVAEVERAAEACRRALPDVVLAVGGGAAIDIAKMARSFAAGDGAALDYATGAEDLAQPSASFLAVPTTAGSGSEATRFAVVYIDGVKRSIEHKSMRPDVAVVDPLLCRSLPKGVTAASGLDAFCQAVESIWSVGATEASVADAVESLRLVNDHLHDAYACGSVESRTAMSRAAYLAGRAINVTKTTACHALSYTLTTERGVPHGAAVATTLAAMLRYNAKVQDSDCLDPRGANEVRRRLGLILETLGAGDVEEACLRITRLISSVDCPPTLSSAGLDSTGDVAALVARVNAERLANNPRRATQETLVNALLA